MYSKFLIILILGLFSVVTNATDATSEFKNYINKPYEKFRNNLINNGWSPLINKDNEKRSFYAQEVSDKGYSEVINCISMERDECEFAFIKKQKIIFIKTKDKNFIVYSITLK
jgi:hypothetical protein